MSTETITIPGQRDIAITAILTRSGGRELAVLLPGFTYRNTMPALHFSRLLMLERGADVLAVNYAYDLAPGYRDTSDDEKFAWIGADGRAALAAALELGAYERITIIGKSLGTIAMGWHLADEPRLAGADCIWLTPSIVGTPLRERMRACRQRSLVVIGTRDPAYGEDVVEGFRAEGKTVAVIPDADHGLDRAGDALGSLEALAETIRHMRDWLSQR